MKYPLHLLWVDEIRAHHFETMAEALGCWQLRGIIMPGFPGCRISSIHSIVENQKRPTGHPISTWEPSTGMKLVKSHQPGAKLLHHRWSHRYCTLKTSWWLSGKGSTTATSFLVASLLAGEGGKQSRRGHLRPTNELRSGSGSKQWKRKGCWVGMEKDCGAKPC